MSLTEALRLFIILWSMLACRACCSGEGDRMKIRLTSAEGVGDPVFLTAVTAAAVLAPAQAFAAQVGCFITAVLLGMMFLVGIGITSLVKHLLARYVWKVPRTPWLRLFGLTWLELMLGISVFATIRTSFWLTVIIYLPFAALLNLWLLGGVSRAGETPVLRRRLVMLLFPASLPLSIQIAGLIWSTLTNMITFTDLKV